MNIEDIILIVIIGVAAIYSIRRIYLILFSKKPPKCSGCGGNCCLKDNNTSDCDHDCR